MIAPAPRALARATLDNGLAVFVREDRKAPVVTANLWVRVGSNHEDDGVLGWSHGIEHMLFKGSARRGPGDAAREVREAGGAMNAGTGYETTNYYVTVPRRNFAVAVDILADAVVNSVFDERELDRERGVLIEENRMYRDRPSGYGLTWEKLLALAFSHSNYRRHIGGPDESLRDTPRDRILDYKNRFYVPNNAALVIAGDVSADDAIAAARAHFGAWRSRAVAANGREVEPPQRELRYRAFGGPVTQVYLKMGWHGGAETERDTFVTEVLLRLLARGRSSRLYREVLEKRGLVSEIATLAEKGPRESFFALDFVTEAEKLEAAQEAIFEQIDLLRREPVRAEELERAKNFLHRSFVLGQETVEAQAHAVGYYFMMGDETLVDRYPEIVESIERDDLVRVAAERFGRSQCSIVVYHPEGAAAGAIETDAGRTAARLAPRESASPGAGAGSARLAAPRPGGASAPTRADAPAGVTPARTPDSPRFERIALSGGATLLFKRRAALPVVSAGVFLHGGAAQEDASTNGVTGLTQRSMVKGTRSRSSDAIAHESEFFGASIAPLYGYDSCGFSFSTVTKFFDRALDVLADVILEPTFPEAEVERERALVLSEIAQVEDQPFEKAALEFQRAIFPNDSYGLPLSGTDASVRGLSRERLAAWRERFYRSRNLLFAVAGDLDRDAVVSALERAFAAAPAGGDADVAAPGAAASLAAPREIVIEKDVQQAVILLGARGPAAAAPERYALTLLCHVMSGMGNRLFVELRDKRSLCYYTGMFYRPMRRAGVVGAYVGTSPDKESAARDALRGELANVVDAGVTPAELDRAKNSIIGQFAIGRQTNSAEAGLAARNELLGLGFEETERFEERVLAVTREEVAAAARRWVTLDTLSTTVVRPRRGEA